MKTLLSTIFSLVFLSTSWLGSNYVADPGLQKHALVFAIGDYPESGGWGKISSGNDVPLIVSALEMQGFPMENITVVRDGEATKKGIEAAFDKYIINSPSIDAGDIVFVHFSSHGQQIMDNNEDEIDGFDEAVIPYDAALTFQRGVYEGEKHLRDDELGELFGKVRGKLGPDGNLLVLIDACHSGTGTRGLVKARGTEKKMAPDGYEPEIKTSSRGEARGQLAFTESTGDNDAWAPMVTISGASADELNYETMDDAGNGVGSLSYAFSKVMTNAKSTMSYRELFDRIKLEMRQRVPQQTPQIEGTIDQELFGGAFVEAKPYFLPEHWEDDKTAFVKAGSLQGLHDSTRVALFDLGATDLAQADTLAKGYVVDASLTESYLVLDEPLEESARQEIKAVVSSRNYASLKVDVQLDLDLEAGAVNQIREQIKASGTANFVSSNPDLLITNKAISRSGAIEVFSAYDQSLATLELRSTSPEALEKTADSIIKTIKKQARTDFLRNLEMEDARREVHVEIVPLKGEITRGQFKLEREMDVAEFRTETGNIVFEDGQVFRLRIKNTGYRDAYFTILDFTPDGKLSLVIPNNNSSMEPADYFVRGGDTVNLDQLFIMQAPYGSEMFKVIATEQPLDLRPIVNPLRSTRSASNPFQNLMEDAASTSRAGTLSMGSSDANISSVVFNVKPGDQ